MPLTIVRAPDSRTLWDACVDRFLEQVGDNPGPSGFDAHVWFAQESQVDLLYETAVARGVKGWLGPPVTTMRQLAARFEIRQRRVGLLTRRRLISRLAGQVARDVGMQDPSRSDGVVRGHMLDALFGELLPEGVTPEQLERALAALPTDDFARRRNQWIVGTYRRYLRRLAELDRIDTRQTNALIASIVDAGGLLGALRGATRLHVYGLYMTRSRLRLLRALAAQRDVDVRLYVLSPAADDPEASDPEAGEWEAFAQKEGCKVKDLPPAADTASPTLHVQPTPDTQRETEWVARQVKRLLVEGDEDGRLPEPHRIAVVARSGHEDTGRMHRALRDAGVTATTIVRARLTEIAALKALMSLFRGAAASWTYRTLRPVLDNSLFGIDLDLRPIDHIAATRRVEGLEQWEAELQRLIEKLGDTYESGTLKDRSLRGKGLYVDAVERVLEEFRLVRAALEPLSASRTEAEWIELTRAMLLDREPAAFNLRRHLCDPVGRRYDVVRLDQRGVRQAETLLREWLDLDHPDAALDPDDWRQLLQRMLEANELSITTPIHKGVQVLEAHDAALLPFDHVFVIHANDGVFPRPVPAGGVLGNTEREALRAAGIPMSFRDLELQRERALWRSVTAAGEIAVSYRSADPSGTPLLPSLLVPEHDETTELPRTRSLVEADDDRFAPVTAAQANQRAAVALHQRMAGTDEAAASLQPGTPELLPHAVLAAVAESHRDPGHTPLPGDAPALHPNPWNGWLRDPRVHESLSFRFGDEYRWSASSLESYSQLPFHFLLQKVLRYEEMKEAREEVEPTVFGSAAHDLLEKFYAQVKDNPPNGFTERAERAFEQAVAEVQAEAQTSEEWKGAPLLWEQEWRKIRDLVRAYLEWELAFIAEKGERPDLLEYGFGYDDDKVFVQGKDVAGRDARLRLCGRIDRVDRGPDGAQVLDYKKGYTPGGNNYLDGTTLQAVLYMDVLENEGREMSRGYYRSLTPTRRGGRATYGQYNGEVKRGQAKYGAALRFALSIPGRVRQGLFEPVLSFKGGDKWKAWHPGRDIARSQSRLPSEEVNRYEHADPVAPEPVSVPEEVVRTWTVGSVAEDRATADVTAAAPADEPPKKTPSAEPPPGAPARLPFDDTPGGDDA